jgi:shikimate dehydrogenase
MVMFNKADKPTLYFIGVTTGKSSVMKLFPKWAEALGLHDAVIKGVDMKLHDEPEAYRKVVDFIKHDPLSYGALVTTHKIDLYNAAKDMFEYLDPYATMFGELSSISKKESRLEGYAKDPISSGLSMEAFIPEKHWLDTGGEAYIMGAGGSAIAIASNLIKKENGQNMPSRVVIANRSTPRLKNIERILTEFNPNANCEYYHTPNVGQNDELLAGLKPHSLVVNATGLGKDRPGSPLTDTCVFPENALVWELNYRGDLRFMHQALEQKEAKGLHVEDGWIYFIHGWTQVIQEVFHIDISPVKFDEVSKIAQTTRTGA